jgi:hypothetical protein
MLALAELSCVRYGPSGAGITNLTGLEYAPSLLQPETARPKPPNRRSNHET